MPRFDYPEPFAVRAARQAVRDSLTSHGEQALVFQAFHPTQDPDAERCPNFDDVYETRNCQDCTICYNTGYVGFKSVVRAWTIFEDAPSNDEEQTKRGLWTSDRRSVQLEGDPLLLSGDYIARVSYWDDGMPLTIEGVYIAQTIKQESLRTGVRYGQSRLDIVGQKSTVNRLRDEHPIYSFDFDRVFKESYRGSI